MYIHHGDLNSSTQVYSLPSFFRKRYCLNYTKYTNIPSHMSELMFKLKYYFLTIDSDIPNLFSNCSNVFGASNIGNCHIPFNNLSCRCSIKYSPFAFLSKTHVQSFSSLCFSFTGKSSTVPSLKALQLS